MKTDALVYELFRRWPGVGLQLAGLEPSRADAYEFRSEEIKQTALRLDGILAQPEDSADPLFFVEVQFQPDGSLYCPLFAEIFLYLHRLLLQPRNRCVLAIYQTTQTEHIPNGYASHLQRPVIQRIGLSSLTGQDSPTPGWDHLRLMIDDTCTAQDLSTSAHEQSPRLTGYRVRQLHRIHTRPQVATVYPRRDTDHARHHR